MTGTGTGTPNLVPKPVTNFGVPSPKIGPVAICVPLDFSVDAAYTVTLANLINAGRIDGVQSIFVDNSLNSDSVTISTQQGQQLTIPPNSQAYLPILASTPPDISFTSAGGVLVTVQLLNVQMPAAVWSVDASGGGGGTVVIAGTVAVDIVGQTGTLAVADATLASILDGTIDVALVNTGTVAVSGTVAVTGTVAPLDGLAFTATGTAVGVLSFNAPGPASGIIDTEGYEALSVQITNAGTGCNLIFQGSNDGTNWFSAYAYNTNPQNVPVTTFASSSGVGVYTISKSFRYLRLDLVSYASGILAVSCALMAANPLPGFQYAALTPGTAQRARVQSTAGTNATLIAVSTRYIYGFDIGNDGTTDAWLKFYAKSSAPVPGTDTPIWTAYLPAGRARSFTLVYVPSVANGLGYAITGGAADSDTTAVAANQVTGIIIYA